MLGKKEIIIVVLVIFISNTFLTPVYSEEIGKVEWLSAEYPASGIGVIRITDFDMNLDPNKKESFTIHVWSDSDSGGIHPRVIEIGTKIN